jgi:hypothetical protein
MTTAQLIDGVQPIRWEVFRRVPNTRGCKFCGKEATHMRKQLGQWVPICEGHATRKPTYKVSKL